MKRKMLLIFLLILSLCGLTGCDKSQDNDYSFKEDYESLNETSGYRKVNISSKNPYELVEAGEIVNMINEKKTFYVYFGFSACPWCRSVVEKSIEVAKDNNIDKVYYVDILDIRDKLVYEEGELKINQKGTDDYYKLLDLLSDVLSDYELYDEDNNLIETNEKRIYAPNFVYLKKGEAIKLVEGISSKQTDSYMELTDEILKDEEAIFNDFFE